MMGMDVCRLDSSHLNTQPGWLDVSGKALVLGDNSLSVPALLQQIDRMLASEGGHLQSNWQRVDAPTVAWHLRECKRNPEVSLLQLGLRSTGFWQPDSSYLFCCHDEARRVKHQQSTLAGQSGRSAFTLLGVRSRPSP